MIQYLLFLDTLVLEEGVDVKDQSELTALLQWLESGGRSKAWLARAVGYSYQGAWNNLYGDTGLTECFVVRCFSRILDLPADIFEAHGYMRDGDFVYKRIPLETQAEAS